MNRKENHDVTKSYLLLWKMEESLLKHMLRILFVPSLANVKKDKTSDLNQAYEFHESDMRHGVKKTITVQLWGCEKWALDYVPTPGDLVVNLLKKGGWRLAIKELHVLI